MKEAKLVNSPDKILSASDIEEMGIIEGFYVGPVKREMGHRLVDAFKIVTKSGRFIFLSKLKDLAGKLAQIEKDSFIKVEFKERRQASGGKFDYCTFNVWVLED